MLNICNHASLAEDPINYLKKYIYADNFLLMKSMERQTDYRRTWSRRGCNFDLKLFWGV